MADTSFAACIPSARQSRFALFFCVGAGLLTAALLPFARLPAPEMPGFVAVYQTALVIAFGMTSLLLALQFLRSSSVLLLIIASGSFYTAGIVVLQLLSFPNILAPTRLFGASAATTIWFWTFWHLGPPTFSIVYAVVARRANHFNAHGPGTAKALFVAFMVAAAALLASAILSGPLVTHLPKLAEGDDYSLLIWSGIGPALQIFTFVAILLLWRVTREGRSLLELWLLVSLVLLVFDNFITYAGPVRGSIGWLLGRLEALASASVVLGVYLREVDALHRRALQTEAQLRQAQKMEAVGQLTGGVAHDFNNLLTVIVGALEMIRRKPDDRARILRVIDNALSAAERGQRLNKQLLLFARKESLRPEVVDVNNLLRSSIELFSNSVGEGIETILSLDESVGLVRADPAHIQSAVLNLVVNARDAMPGGGKIVIATSATDCDREYVERTPDSRPGKHVAISVSDEGTGMDNATIVRAVEPFFTTKGPGKGTGLGLSQVYGFVRSSDGHLAIESQVGRGSTVKICMPVHRDLVEAPAVSRRPFDTQATSGKRVLVVDDDPDVLRIAIESLKDIGFEVKSADNAQDALRELQNGQQFDALFSDIVMPGEMNGLDLAKEAKTLHPNMKVVLASGYADPALERPGDVPVIRKPYSQNDLIDHLAPSGG